MTLEDLFEDLSFGELSQLSLGGSETQGINVDNRPVVLSHINRGLTALHKRFLLKKGRLTLPLVEGQTRYTLAADTPPFMQIEYIAWPSGLSSDVIAPRGQNPVLPLNNEGSALSAFTVNHKTLDVPASLWESGARELVVVYRGGHPHMDKGDAAFAPEEIEVDLPEVFREPLMYYVTSNLMNPLGATPEGFHDGNNYAQKYEQACRELEQYGWNETSLAERPGFYQQGFV